MQRLSPLDGYLTGNYGALDYNCSVRNSVSYNPFGSVQAHRGTLAKAFRRGTRRGELDTYVGEVVNNGDCGVPIPIWRDMRRRAKRVAFGRLKKAIPMESSAIAKLLTPARLIFLGTYAVQQDD